MAFVDSSQDIIMYTYQNVQYIWRVTTLWRFSNNKTSELIEINQLSRYLEEDRWFGNHTKPTLENLLLHFDRILKSDLSYPLILSPNEDILDGIHRVAKAMLFKEKKLKIIKLNELPPSDYASIEEVINKKLTQ